LARKPRIHYTGAIYHVMLRGNNRKNIFFSDLDRYYLYSLLEEGVIRFNYKIHAFCLMTNHIHLIIEVGEMTLSKIIQNTAFRYTQRINKNKNRVGHLFQGRYRAKLVENERYLLELSRYIHLNPLEAKIVENSVDYPWSSLRDYLGKTTTQWLTTEKIFYILHSQFFGKNITYEKFVSTGINPEKPCLGFTSTGDIQILDKIILEINSNRASEFSKKLHINEIMEVIARFLDIEISQLKGLSRGHSYAHARGYIALFSQRFTDTTLKELALIFRVDASTLSKAIVRLQKKRLLNSNENEIYLKIERQLIANLKN
jgi:putative transposase